MNKFQRLALLVIIFLLAVIALRLVLSESPVATATAHYEYLVVNTPVQALQDTLAEHAKDGWEPILVASEEGNPQGVTTANGCDSPKANEIGMSGQRLCDDAIASRESETIRPDDR